MIKVCPLDWTNLNPSAPPFEPIKQKDNDKNGVKSDSAIGEQSCSAGGQTVGQTIESGDKKSKSKKTKNKSNKPSVLTLEQLIADKLKIDNKTRRESNSKSNKSNKLKKSHETNNPSLNALDSSAPSRKRGKEREIPKPKRPTTLKRIINNEKCDKPVKTDLYRSDAGEQVDTECEECPDLDRLNKKLLHNKTYREYCDQQLSQAIDQLVTNLLTDLVSFQDRMYSRDPIKAAVKRRLCFGFKEVIKYAKIDKIKVVIIAPDIEKIESKGGLDDYLTTLVDICRANECPIVFALNRQRLGFTTKKKGFVSCVGVLNYDGSQDNFKQSIALCEIARKEYKEIYDQSLNALRQLSDQQINQIISQFPDIPKEFIPFKVSLNPSDRRVVRTKKSSAQ